MSTEFDPYYKWLGIPPDEQPPHHYRLLAIKTFEEDPDVIEAAGDRLMGHLRTFQTGKHSAESQKLLNEVAAAKICLLRPDKKAAYDAQLHEILERQSSGEDTSTQLQGLRTLDQMIADEIARPVSQRRKQSSSSSPWLAVGVAAAVLLIGVVVWSLFGRGKPQEVAKKAEASSQPSAVSSQVEAGAAQKSGVPARQGHKSIAQGASPGKSSQEPQEQKAPAGPMESATPPQPLPKAEVGSRQPAVGSQRKPTAQDPRPKTQDPASKAEGSNQPSAVSRQMEAGAAHKPSPQSLIPNPQSRSPVPSVADQEESKKEAQDLFRDDYAKAKKPSERAELARAILKKGVETREPPADHFALLCLARDVAISAEDDKLAYETIDEIAKSFEIEPLSWKADALTAMSKSTRSGVALHKTLCQQALTLGQEALDQDKLDVADTLAKLSFAEAGKVRDKDLVQRSRDLAKKQQEAAKAHSAVQDAFKTLQEKPDDPAANLAVGKYLCFTKGDWSKGLLHLTKGDDAKLRSLAEEDRKLTPPEWEPASGVPPPDPPPAAAALKLADAWWEAGQALPGKQRDHILLRAGYWYHQSFSPDLAALAVTKINTRLDQIDKVRRQYPAPPLAIAPFDARQAREHQRRWADYLGVPVVMTNSIGMKFVLIPPGEFMMGTTAEEIAQVTRESQGSKEHRSYVERLGAEGPQHDVSVTKPFYLGMYEVTQQEYVAVIGGNPSGFCEQGTHRASVATLNTKLHPVETVSWSEANQFCRKLTAVCGNGGRGRIYRLPSEAQWEYACRAGSQERYSFGNKESDVGLYGWHKRNSGDRTHPVGGKRSSPWGLFDMHGNVSEWCADWFDEEYYAQSAAQDPTGPPKGKARVIRGGCATNPVSYLRSARRYWQGVQYRDPYVGFRVATEP